SEKCGQQNAKARGGAFLVPVFITLAVCHFATLPRFLLCCAAMALRGSGSFLMSEPTGHPGAGPRPPRRSSLSARGEPALWLMGASLVVSVTLILGLLGIILVQGLSTCWPRPVDHVQMRDGSAFLGVPVEEEAYQPSGDDLARFESLVDAGELEQREGAQPRRRLYRVGNREWLGQPFRWVPLFDVESVERPEAPLFLERLDWGIFIGMPEAIIERRQREIPAGDDVVEEETVDGQRIVRRIDGGMGGETPGGATRITEDIYLAEDPATIWETFQRL